MQYAQAVFQCVWLPVLITPLVLFTARPSIYGLAAAGAIDVLAALKDVYDAARIRLPPVASIMERGAALALPYIASVSSSEISSWSLQRKWEAANTGTMRTMAMAEIILAILCVVELLTPYRNFILTFILWQTLQMKFTLSQYTREGFAKVHSTLLRLTLHPMCPSIVAQGYGKLSAFLRSQVKTMEEAQAEAQRNAAEGQTGGAGGLLGRCSIQ